MKFYHSFADKLDDQIIALSNNCRKLESLNVECDNEAEKEGIEYKIENEFVLIDIWKCLPKLSLLSWNAGIHWEKVLYKNAKEMLMKSETLKAVGTSETLFVKSGKITNTEVAEMIDGRDWICGEEFRKVVFCNFEVKPDLQLDEHQCNNVQPDIPHKEFYIQRQTSDRPPKAAV